MKLRTRLFLIFCLLAITPLFILTTFSYTRYCRTSSQRMDEITSQLFQSAVETADQDLDSISRIVSQFHFYNSASDSLPDQLKDFSYDNDRPTTYKYHQVSQSFFSQCQNMVYPYEHIHGIYFFTPSGFIFTYDDKVNGTVSTSASVLQSDWYQETIDLDGKLYISSVEDHALFSGSMESIFFACSVRNVYTHRFLGVLVIDCDPSFLDLTTVNTLPDLAKLTISNGTNGNILYSNNIENFEDGNARIMSQNLALTPLVLTAAFDYEQLYREYNVTAVLLILIAVICIIGFLVLAYVTTRSFVRPIEHLSKKMASQKGHTLEQTSKYLDRTDEIGTLFNEYNAMIDSLNQAVKEDYQDKMIRMDAQMKSMEARINSHFLFNTLEAINSMAEIDENENIATMSLALGNMFRYTLKTKSELVTIQDELNHVQDYISIQEIRFDHRFSLIVDIDESLRSQVVLKLILQPLVENALYHGLKYCTCGNQIRIHGSSDDRNIYLDVWDNGQGMTEEQVKALTSTLSQEASFTELGHRNKQSIGLKNIHTRIQLYYGSIYGLSITSTIGECTNIRLRLPILRREESA